MHRMVFLTVLYDVNYKAATLEDVVWVRLPATFIIVGLILYCKKSYFSRVKVRIHLMSKKEHLKNEFKSFIFKSRQWHGTFFVGKVFWQHLELHPCQKCLDYRMNLRKLFALMSELNKYYIRIMCNFNLAVRNLNASLKIKNWISNQETDLKAKRFPAIMINNWWKKNTFSPYLSRLELQSSQYFATQCHSLTFPPALKWLQLFDLQSIDPYLQLIDWHPEKWLQPFPSNLDEFLLDFLKA